MTQTFTGSILRLSTEKDKMQTDKTIRLFAKNKIIIDSDLHLEGTSTNLFMFAPKWEIEGEYTIILDGKPLTSNPGKARDGLGKGSNGSNGKPGDPGQSAGNIVGIAKTIVNGNKLTITANGGKGGKGQKGGDGNTGEDGADPPRNDAVLAYNSGWDKEKVYEGIRATINLLFPIPYLTITYEISGKKGGKGGNGGDGGIGGLGGCQGSILVFGAINSIVKKAERGDTGEIGEGGSGGKGGRYGRIDTAIRHEYPPSAPLCPQIALPTPSYSFQSSRASRDKGNDGNDGKDGNNGTEREKPTKVLLRYVPETINEYKTFLRDELAKDISQDTEAMKEILIHIENDSEICKLYNTFSLADNLLSMERQFFKIYRRVPLLAYYESLLNRIKEYAKNRNVSPGDTKTLSHIYTATLGRICSLKNNQNADLIINLKEYMNVVISDIKQLQDTNNVASATGLYLRDYERSVSEKSAEAITFIKHEIEPEIKELFESLQNKMIELVNEIANRKNQAAAEEEELLAEKQKLEEALQTQALLSALQTGGKMLSLLGPAGQTASVAINGFTYVAGELTTGSNEAQCAEKINTCLKGLEGSAVNLKQVLRYKQAHFQTQLVDIELEIFEYSRQDPENDMSALTHGVNEIKENLQRALRENDTEVNQNEMRGELVSLLERQRGAIASARHHDSLKTQKRQALIDRCLLITSMGGQIYEVYRKLKEDHAKIDALAQCVRKVEKRIAELNEYENNIYSYIVPMCSDMETDVKATRKQLEDKSRSALDVKRWKIQSKIKDVALQLRRMTEGFNVNSDIVRCMEKIEAGMNIMIQLYDRIQEYQENKKLGAYIADLSSSKSLRLQTDDPELDDIIAKMNLMIKTNVVLGHFERAMNAFKQFVFPFAEFYLDKYSLPETIKLEDDANDLIFNAVRTLGDIRNELSTNLSTVSRYDKSIYTKEFNSLKTYPFFVWSSIDNKTTITRLLNGQEVVLRADVSDGVTENAVKGKAFGINFNFNNVSRQTEFDMILKKFSI